jgi:hypothetical protein
MPQIVPPPSDSFGFVTCGRIVFEGTPADMVADRSTLIGQHLAAYIGTSD